MKQYITGLDIGTSKICAAIAEQGDGSAVKVRGIGTSRARGINKGFVSNLEKLIDSITSAVSEAEKSSGLKAHKVITNISGSSVDGCMTEATLPISRRGREITKHDVRKACDMSRELSMTLEKDLLYGIPQEFSVDDQDGVEDPLGLFGTKLKVKMYAIGALATHIQNIKKAVTYAGYDLINVIPTSVATTKAMLTNEDMSNGAIVIDMGGGVTELAIYNGGALRYFDSVNIGGMDLTARLSANLKLPFANAESIKQKYGSIAKEDMEKNENNIFDIDGRHVTVNSDIMNNHLRERFDELFYVLYDRLKSSKCPMDAIPSVIITGGSASLSGMLEMYEVLFGIPVRMGRISNVKCNPQDLANPAHTAAISLAKYALESHPLPARRYPKGKSMLVDTFLRLRELLNEYF